MNLACQSRFYRFGGYINDEALKTHLDDLKYIQNIIIRLFDNNQLVVQSLFCLIHLLKKNAGLALSGDKSYRKKSLGKGFSKEPCFGSPI